MALKLRKDIKKSSYYVWFLGAKESKGLRGVDFVLPVIQHLEEREKDVEPFKVTLQVSHKGLKIIQNIVAQNPKSSKSKNETIKHFIPHNTITCVHQQEDIIACILLLFNPVTKCPLHVHAYRCDSLETAGLLRAQLQLLIERPENQKKFAEIENRLLATSKERKKVDSSLGSDAGTSTRESESSEERFGSSAENTRVTTLYDSVAAELRAKLLCKNNQPILLPPRDYDTVHRAKGNLTGIELRRCLNSNIVGGGTGKGAVTGTTAAVAAVVSAGNKGNSNNNNKGGGGGGGKRLESSGGSSGIGSDHAPSPESPDVVHHHHHHQQQQQENGGYPVIDGHSTSDEEWNDDYPDPSIYLLNQTSTVPKPQPPVQELDKSAALRYQQRSSPKNNSNNRHPEHSPPPPLQESQHHQRGHDDDTNYRKKLANAASNARNDRYVEQAPEGVPSLERNRYYERQWSFDEERAQEHQPQQRYSENRMDSYQKKVANSRKLPEKEQRSLERRFVDQDDGFEDNDNVVYRSKSREASRSRSSKYQEQEAKLDKAPIPKARQIVSNDDTRYYQERADYNAQQIRAAKHMSYAEDPSRSTRNLSYHRSARPEDLEFFEATPEMQASGRYGTSDREYYEETGSLDRRHHRKGGISPDLNTSPRDRFNDAKEKFLLLEKERDQMQIKLRAQQLQQQQEMPISPVLCKEQPYLKRHESLTRFNYEQDEPKPKPAPRTLQKQPAEEQIRYRNQEQMERYRNEKYDQKRRSMYNLIEDEHRKNSNEIAKELKRRSYMESNNQMGSREDYGYRTGNSYDYQMEKEMGYNTLEKDQHFSPKDQHYNPKDPHCNPKDPHYNPKDPHYNPKDPHYNPKDPHYNPKDPHYNSKDPHYNSKDQHYNQKDQHYNAKDQHYNTKEQHFSTKDPHFSSKDQHGHPFSKSQVDLDKMGEMGVFTKNQKGKKTNNAGCRHSYVEPKYRPDKNGKKHFAEMLHRTNSSVSNTGRVGIASIHPY